jgi:hypothetical protein
MPARLAKATLYLFLAYWIVTILGILLTFAFAILFNPPTPQQLGVPLTQAPAYLMTLPYHPILNLLVWPWFAWLYLRGLSPDVPRAREGIRLGIFWVVITMLVDLVGWVLIPHPWRMTFKEFYVDYQPWINLIYLIILLAPRAVAAWLGRPVAISE